MNTEPSSTSPERRQRRNQRCDGRRAVTAHFAGRMSPPGEAAMRAHLGSCAPCRRHYERHLILERLDPRARPAAQRLAGGLGLRFAAVTERAVRWRRWVAAGAIPLAAAVVLVSWAAGPDRRSSPGVDGAFVARGASPSAARASAVWTYRVGADPGAPRLADGVIGAGDELAFAYSNPTGKPYVMIFGVDEHRHVYWFHPGWRTGQPAPPAIPAAAGPGPHELGEAIRHAMDGRRLSVYGIFSDDAITATAVEARVRAASGPQAAPAFGDGVVVVRQLFDVRPGPRR